MTTSYREHFVDSVRTQNDGLVLRDASVDVSAFVWTASRCADLQTDRTNVLAVALSRIRERCPLSQGWLVAANRVLQPDTRVTRHLGLWKALERRGISLPGGEYLEEHVVSSSDGVRFFGAMRWNDDQNSALALILSAESGSIVFTGGIDPSRKVFELVSYGWRIEDRVSPPDALLQAAAREEMLLVSVYGEFDDQEVAAAIIGRKDAIMAISAQDETPPPNPTRR